MRDFTHLRRLSPALAIALALAGVTLLGAAIAQATDGQNNGNGQGHTPVTLCHFVPAHGGSFITITVDDDGSSGNANLQGHAGHENDIIPAPAEGCPSGEHETPTAHVTHTAVITKTVAVTKTVVVTQTPATATNTPETPAVDTATPTNTPHTPVVNNTSTPTETPETPGAATSTPTSTSTSVATSTSTETPAGAAAAAAVSPEAAVGGVAALPSAGSGGPIGSSDLLFALAFLTFLGAGVTAVAGYRQRR